jgi:hypothetical protein
MNTLLRVVTFVISLTIAAAPAPLLAQQKQDTMDKKESKKPAKKKAAKKKSDKKSEAAKKKSGETNPNPGPSK